MRTIKIGRAKDNDVVVEHQAVSAHHGTLYICDDNSIFYEDYSTNGTMIDGDYIHKKRVRIRGNEKIILPGDLSCMVSDLTGIIVGDSKQNGNIEYCSDSFAIDSSAAKIKMDDDQGIENITFIGALQKFFTHYAVFSGRSRRSEFWYMYLWSMIFSFILSVLIILTSLSHIALLESDPISYLSSISVWVIITVLWALATLVPSLALIVRRLHDSGKSGLFLLFYFLPGIGSLVIFIFMLIDSEPHANRYGPCPKKFYNLKSATIIQYTIKGRFMSR